MNRRIVIALVVVVVAVLAIREAFDPWLVLYIDDWFSPKPPPLSASLDDRLALRLYSDTRPHIGKIDELQKGLVLVAAGRERIEEGFGFGAPIVNYRGQAYLSRHAEVIRSRSGGQDLLVKRYIIDVADYPSRPLRTKYRDVAPLGTVVFSYTLMPPDTVSVTVDLAGLTVDWDTAYVMNEQGARAFPVYVGYDEGGAAHQEIRTGDEVGIWRQVQDRCACWRTEPRSVQRPAIGFCVETEPGRAKYIGRERYWQYHWAGIYALSWSGVDIELLPPATRYSYAIRLAQATSGEGEDVIGCP